MRYYTKDEIEQITIHKLQMQELCRRRDKDVFDVIYNVCEELADIDGNFFVASLQSVAIEGKRLDVNPNVPEYSKNTNFDDVSRSVGKYYDMAIDMIVKEGKVL